MDDLLTEESWLSLPIALEYYIPFLFDSICLALMLARRHQIVQAGHFSNTRTPFSLWTKYILLYIWIGTIAAQLIFFIALTNHVSQWFAYIIISNHSHFPNNFILYIFYVYHILTILVQIYLLRLQRMGKYNSYFEYTSLYWLGYCLLYSVVIAINFYYGTISVL